jgi:hypothetical protein
LGFSLLGVKCERYYFGEIKLVLLLSFGGDAILVAVKTVLEYVTC